MLSLDEYLANPCRASSIPYWKARQITVPSNIRIVHRDDFEAATFCGWHDAIYFRLLHRLNRIDVPTRSDIIFAAIEPAQMEQVVSLINACYDDLQVTFEQMQGYTKTTVYTPDLWILAKDPLTNESLGCGIADYDEEIGELILEWIQVLPDYRRKGVGQAIVNELLRRKPAGTRFATVSGKVDSACCPEALYRKCGFTGQDYWHILHK